MARALQQDHLWEDLEGKAKGPYFHYWAYINLSSSGNPNNKYSTSSHVHPSFLFAYNQHLESIPKENCTIAVLAHKHIMSSIYAHTVAH
jgi:hypothetical protein